MHFQRSLLSSPFPSHRLPSVIWFIYIDLLPLIKTLFCFRYLTSNKITVLDFPYCSARTISLLTAFAFKLIHFCFTAPGVLELLSFLYIAFTSHLAMTPMTYEITHVIEELLFRRSETSFRHPSLVACFVKTFSWKSFTIPSQLTIFPRASFKNLPLLAICKVRNLWSLRVYS